MVIVGVLYKRVLLKLSGESLADERGFGLGASALRHYAAEIASATQLGAQVALVLGGGNIFRGMQGVAQGGDRVKGDQMGMLATVINSLAVSQALQQAGVNSEVFTATPMMPIATPYSVEGVRAAWSAGHVAILAGGTGNPFFTTDSAAALRAAELRCDALLKGTRVDGVYTADPEKEPTARRYDTVTYQEAYEQKLHIMDMTAFTLCQENGLPTVVFDVRRAGNLAAIVQGERVGTLVS